jgi:cell division protein FtsI (penicillin-binding protein 3)
MAPYSKDGNRHDIQKVLKQLNIQYEIQSEEDWVQTKANGEKVELKKRAVNKKTVPNVIGLTAKDAVYLIEHTGMSARVIGRGKVVKQTVPPGTAVFRGGLIEITLE